MSGKTKEDFFSPLHLLQTESKLHRVKLSPGAQNASGSASDIWTLPRSGCSFPFMFLRMWGDLEQRRWTNTPLQSEFFRACHGNHIYFLNMSNLASFLSSFFVVLYKQKAVLHHLLYYHRRKLRNKQWFVITWCLRDCKAWQKRVRISEICCLSSQKV